MPRGDLLGSLEHLVLLALIRLKSNAYGMTVRREIEERTGRNISIGAVYTTLERLQTKGYVSSLVGNPLQSVVAERNVFSELKLRASKRCAHPRKPSAR